MLSKISELLNDLPDDVGPVASGLIDAVAEGFLDNSEAVIGYIYAGDFTAAYQEGLRSLSAKGLIDLLAVVNTKMDNTVFDYKEEKLRQKAVIMQLTILAFSLLRKEIKDGLTG